MLFIPFKYFGMYGAVSHPVGVDAEDTFRWLLFISADDEMSGGQFPSRGGDGENRMTGAGIHFGHFKVVLANDKLIPVLYHHRARLRNR